MNGIIVIAALGILLGLIIEGFAVFNMKKLPGWGKLAFPLIGILIEISGICLLVGANMMK